MANSLELLKSIEKNLTEIGIENLVLPKSENNAVSQVLIPLEPDNEKSPFFQALFVEDLLDEGVSSPVESGILQFFVTFNSEKEIKNLLDTFKFLANLNKLITIGSFGFSETDGVYYRHSFLLSRDNLDMKAIKESVSLMNFFAKKFYPTIISLSAGKTTLENALELATQQLS